MSLKLTDTLNFSKVADKANAYITNARLLYEMRKTWTCHHSLCKCIKMTLKVM